MGFRIDLVGENASLAAQAGIRATRLRASVLLASAAFAGLAGAIQLFGLSHRLTTGLTGGVGYTGVLVAVLGRSRPVAVATAAVVFAALVTGGEALERDGVPRTLSAVVQAVLIVGVALWRRGGGSGPDVRDAHRRLLGGRARRRPAPRRARRHRRRRASWSASARVR